MRLDPLSQDELMKENQRLQEENRALREECDGAQALAVHRSKGINELLEERDRMRREHVFISKPITEITAEFDTLRARVAKLTAERDEARALKVPATTDAVLIAQMDAAVARTCIKAVEAERDAERLAKEYAHEKRLEAVDDGMRRLNECSTLRARVSELEGQLADTIKSRGEIIQQRDEAWTDQDWHRARIGELEAALLRDGRLVAMAEEESGRLRKALERIGKGHVEADGLTYTTLLSCEMAKIAREAIAPIEPSTGAKSEGGDHGL